MAWPHSEKIERKCEPVALHTVARHLCIPKLWSPKKKPWARDTANLCKPKSRTTSVRGLCPNGTQVLDNSSCVTLLARACELFFARPLSLATPPEEQPRSHIAYPRHFCPYFRQVDTTRPMPNAMLTNHVSTCPLSHTFAGILRYVNRSIRCGSSAS